MNRIGIDLGGTKIEAAVLGRDGELLWSERVATPKGDYAGTLQAIAGLVQRAKIISGDVAGVGVATPGSENPQTQLHRNANSTCLNGMPLRQDLQRLIGVQVRTANDANCFALSEAIDGAGSGAPIVFGVILGTGCGGGIVVDQIVRNGANGIAGEWGHTALPNALDVERAREKCWCGRACCLEQFISGSAVEMDHALVNNTNQISLKQMRHRVNLMKCIDDSKTYLFAEAHLAFWQLQETHHAQPVVAPCLPFSYLRLFPPTYLEETFVAT